MSIFKTIADSDIALYVDFRSGSGIDISGNYTTSIGANGYLVHKKLYNANTLGLVSSANVALNKSDFTIIAKHRTVTKLNGHFYTFGTGNDRGLLLYNNVLQTRIDSTYYTETLVGTKYDAGGEFVSYGFSADRDANGQFYVNGVAVGTAKNISAKANYDINYSTPILTTYTENTFETQYVLLIKKALTATEMAQLTAELESKKWTSKTKSITKLNNFIKNGLFNNSNFWTLETDATSGNKWTIENSLLKHTGFASTGTLVTASGLTKNIEVGKQYKLSFTLDAQVSGRFGIFESSGGATIKDYTTIYLEGRKTYSYTWTATAKADTIRIIASQVSNSFEISNIKIEEVGKEQIIYKTESGIKAVQKTYSTAGQPVDSTDLILNSGSVKIVDGVYNGEKVKILESTSTSSCSIPVNKLKQTPNESAYGEWEFIMSAPNAKFNIIKFISSTTDTASTSGDNYNISMRPSSGSNIIQIRVTNSNLIQWGSYFTGDQFYKIKVTRTGAGLFSLFIDDVLIGTATNTTYTSSNYLVFVMETGSKIILSSERGTYGIIKK